MELLKLKHLVCINPKQAAFFNFVLAVELCGKHEISRVKDENSRWVMLVFCSNWEALSCGSVGGVVMLGIIK